MGVSKLNVWLRDEECKPLIVSECGYVNISHCTDLESSFEYEPVPIGAANVDVEVSPGCYMVSGCVRLGDSMEDCVFTDKVMVVVGCNQELCVNLIVPKMKTLALRYVLPFIRKARSIEIPERDILAAAQTIMAVGGISKDEMINIIEDKRRCIKATEPSDKESEEISKEYQEILNIIKQTAGSSMEEKKEEETKLETIHPSEQRGNKKKGLLKTCK